MGNGSGVVNGVSEDKASTGDGDGERGNDDALGGAKPIGSTSEALDDFRYRCAEP